MNVNLSIEDLYKLAPPAEKILWQQALLILGEKTPIRQIYYHGAIAGSEFTVDSATKLYLSLSTIISYSGGSVNSTSDVILYQTGGVILSTPKNVAAFWDTTAVLEKMQLNSFEVNNILFCYLTQRNYSHIKFIGYKLGT